MRIRDPGRPAPAGASHALQRRPGAESRQVLDATFGGEATDAVTFHRLGVEATVPSQPAIPVFDDSVEGRYWSADNPWSSTKVAGSGTSLEVFKSDDCGSSLQVKVRFR